MIPSFNQAFKKSPSTEPKLPQAILDHLNTTIPDGTRYIADNTGNITMVADGKPVIFGGFTIILTEEIKKNVKPLTHDNVLIYAYNAQIELKLKLKKDGWVIVNGQELPVESLHKNVFRQLKYANMEWSLIPEKFPEPREITISSDEYSRVLRLRRVPYPSLTEIHFETEEEKSLKIRMNIDKRKKRNDFSVTYNLNYASSIQEIVETISIFNAVADGNAYFMDEKLLIEDQALNNDRFDDQTFEFWKKVLELEKVLNIKFEPLKENPDFQTICDIEQLYQNLILKNPIREDKMFTSISSESKENDIAKMKESVGKVLYFQYTGDLKFSIFNRTFSCPALFGMFQCKLEGVEEDGEKTKLIFANESEEKKGYTSILCFATREELDSYHCYDVDDNHAKELESAKRSQDYLQE